MSDVLSPFITSNMPYWTAFLAGLLGSVHCVGMCGGVVSALTFGLPEKIRNDRWRVLPYLLSYNIGRVSTYILGGAVVGYAGSLGGDLLSEYEGWFYLRSVAALFMIMLGLYLGGWWFGLSKVESLGGRLWARIRPLGKGLMPVTSPIKALGLGALWGWLPCGLIYSVLIWAFAAGGWFEGAMFMLAFGLGTLPALFGVSLLAINMNAVLQRQGIRWAAGAVVIGFGVWTLVATWVNRTNIGLGCVPPI